MELKTKEKLIQYCFCSKCFLKIISRMFETATMMFAGTLVKRYTVCYN